MTTTGTCIYCKTVGALTEEHVVPRLLGGNAKPPLVLEAIARKRGETAAGCAVVFARNVFGVSRLR